MIDRDFITYRYLLDTLSKHNRVDLVTENGITITSIEYLKASSLDLNDGNIYLIVSDRYETNIKLNYRAVKRVRIFDECIELTI